MTRSFVLGENEEGPTTSSGVILSARVTAREAKDLLSPYTGE